MRTCWTPLAAALVALAAPPASAQAPSLPDPAGLDRLNLRTEWAAYVPVAAGRDGFSTVQVADETQIFVQTNSGLLVCLDAATGARQWGFRYPAQYVVQYPVGWNDEFVFAVNVSRLLAFHRRTGVVAFDFELPGSATAGPAPDKELVYVTLNGTKFVAYRFPPALLAPTRPTGKFDAKPPANAADVVADRYRTPGADAGGLRDTPNEENRVRLDRNNDVGLSVNQRTPSISALPSVTPPYTLDNRGLFGTPSVTAIASMRQPYQFRPDFLRYNQQTPSITVIPASAARVNELGNFAPRGVQPTVAWTHAARNRVAAAAVVTDLQSDSGKLNDGAVRRVWLTTEGADLEALDRRTGKTVTAAPLQGRVATPMVGPIALAPDRVLGLVGLTDGNVIAVDLLRGSTESGIKADWRASVGGLMNYAPVATRDSVYASGSQSGVTRIDMATGDVLWKTADPAADRVLAVNDEFVYVRDRRGELLVYDRKTTGAAQPLARLPVQGFGFPVSNAQTDRVLLASDSGIMLSLRDANPKYARATRLIPPVPATAAKAAAVTPEPKKEPAPPAAPPAEPKKDPEPPKKDGEKI